MGEEQKPQASFLARRNAAGANAPQPPQASAVPAPNAPPPAIPPAPVAPPRSVPPPPTIPPARIANAPQFPSAILKPKSSSAGPITGTTAPGASTMRSATMQSGKFVIPGSKAPAPSSITSAHKMPGIRPGFAPAGPAVPGKGTIVPNNIMRSGVQNVSALISGQMPLAPQSSALAPPAPMGRSVQSLQHQDADVSRTEPSRAPFNRKAALGKSRATAEHILQGGLDHYDRGEYELAMAAYNEAIQADPSFAMSYNNLGMVLIDLERYSDAMNALYESIRHDANYGEAYNNLGFVLRRLGNNIEAASAYRRFLELEPDVDEGERISTWIETVLAENGLNETPPLNLPDAPPERAQVDSPQEDVQYPPKIKKMAAWEAAAGNMEMAAPLNALGEFEEGQQPPAQNFAPQPTNVFGSQNPRGGAALTASMGATGPMVSQQIPTLSPEPTHTADGQLTEEERNRQTALIEKSLDEFANGSLDEALNLVHEAIEIDTNFSEAHTALGKILVRQEQLKEGIEQLELAIQLDPDDPAPHYVLGFTLRAMERNVEAAEIYETFLRLMPDALDGPKMRQWIMHIKGIAEAESAPDREDEGFIDEDPILTETDKMYSAALERFKTARSSQNIIDDCERILAEDPNHFRTRILLGRAFMRDGEFEKATDNFQMVLALRKDCSEALFYIGQSYEKSGDSPRALKAYRRYIDENPNGPRVEKLRAWFLSHGVAETGRGLNEQVQCEWCLRFFEQNEISMHESKATCNGCLTLMGSTPIQDANQLETVDSSVQSSKSALTKRQRSPIVKLAMFGASAAAALLALGYFTPLLDSYLKMAGIVKKKPTIIVGTNPKPNPPPGNNIEKPAGTGSEVTTVPSPSTGSPTTPLTAPATTQTLTSVAALPAALSGRFDGTKVKVGNVPEKDFSVFSRWAWKPELDGVEELDKSLPGWKREIFFSKEHPVGMSVEDGTIVWTSESKDFDALKRGEKFAVEVTIKGFWIGPEGARRDLFVTTKSFVVSSQFGYDIGPELDVGLAPNARNVELLGTDADGDGIRDVIVTQGSLGQGSIQSVLCGPEGLKQTTELANGARYSSACAFPLNGKINAGVLCANWQTGEVKLFVLKAGRLEAGPSVKFPAGILSVAAMETGRNKTSIAALSSTAGTLSVALYEEGKGFGSPSSVAIPNGGGNGRLLPWKSTELGSGFLAVSPLAEEPLRFVPCVNGELEKGTTAVRSVVKDEGVITGVGHISCAQNGANRLALVLGGNTSHVMVLEEKSGKFTEVGTKTPLPGPALGLAVWDFNKDGNDDLFVVTRDEVCFYFTNDAGGLLAGPRFSNPGMLGPVVMLGYGNSSRPDIAVLNENKKARVFKPVGVDRTGAPVKAGVGLAP